MHGAYIREMLEAFGKILLSRGRCLIYLANTSDFDARVMRLGLNPPFISLLLVRRDMSSSDIEGPLSSSSGATRFALSVELTERAVSVVFVM